MFGPQEFYTTKNTVWKINETVLSRTYKRRVAFEHYLSKSTDRFYRPGYNLLCSNIGGRHSICHSVRAPLCWQRSPRSRGEVHRRNRNETGSTGTLEHPVQIDHNRPCRQIYGSGGQLVRVFTMMYHLRSILHDNCIYMYMRFTDIVSYVTIKTILDKNYIVFFISE